MDWSGFAAIVEGVTLLGGGLGVAVAFGRRDQKIVDLGKSQEMMAETIKALASREQLQTVIDRACEDRDHDNKRIEDLFESRNEMQGVLIENTAILNNMAEQFKRMEGKLDLALSAQAASGKN